MRKVKLSALALVVAILGISSTGAAPAPPEQPPNLLGAADFADPFVLRDGETYFAFATGTHGRHVQLASSRDLVTWTVREDALPALPAWASPAPGFTWAPSVLARGDRFVLYYTTRDRTLDLQCLSRAISTRPEGPYVDDSTGPFVCQTALCGSIDPSPFVDADGIAYLYWKSDENDRRCGAPARLWGQRLTNDALGVTGPAVPLLVMDQPWEEPLIEGPSMIARDGSFHLFYSANWYESPRYAVGHAVCASPLGPCAKSSDRPIFGSTSTLLGPGGQEFFDDARGNTFVAYHAWSAPHASYPSGGTRSLRIGRLGFEGTKPIIDPQPVSLMGSAANASAAQH